MPLTGALEGYFDYHQADADIANRKALALERAATAQSTMLSLQQQKQTQGVLQQIFGIQGPQEGDPGLAEKYRKAAAATLSMGDAKTSLDFANRASQMDLHTAQAAKDFVDTRIRAQTQLGQIMGSVAESNDNDAYREAMMQYIQAGGSPPAWYTGDIELDRPNVKRLADASMTRAQQLTVQHQAVTEDIADRRLKRQQDLDQQNIAVENRRIAATEERLRVEKAWKEAEAKRLETRDARDREKIAVDRAKLLEVKREDVDTAFQVIKSVFEEKGAAMPTPALMEAKAREIAAKAKRRYAEGGREEDFPAIVEEMVKREIKAGGIGVEEGGWFSKDKGKIKLGGGQASQPAAPATSGEEWISRAMKANPGMTREQVIEEGKKRGKL